MSHEDRSTGNQPAGAAAAGVPAAQPGARPQVVILTGGCGCGKTTVCDQTASAALLRGFTVAGILTRTRTGADGVSGLDVEDVGRRLQVPLAETTEAAAGPVIGGFRFHQRGLDWGDAVLAGALPCDLFVVDEVGPLELVKDTGWTNAVPAVRDGRFRVALVVIRPALVQAFLDRIPGMHVTMLTVTPENRGPLPARILSFLGDAS